MTPSTYVVGFALLPRHRIVLIRKEKPAWQKGRLNGVGGKIEPGETPLEAMVREFEEETGVRVEQWVEYLRMHTSNGIIHFFVHRAETDLPVQTMTAEMVQICSYHNLPGHVFGPVRYQLPLALYSQRDLRWPVSLYTENWYTTYGER